MEDSSVDVSSLTRPEVLTGLQLGSSPKINVTQLRKRLRKKLELEHPIHGYLNDLKNEVIQDLYRKLSPDPSTKIKMFARMKKFIDEQFF